MSASPFLLLGESPNAATVNRPRLWLLPDRSGIRHSANRLLEYTGFELREYLRLFERDNLLHELPPKAGKGRAFSIKAAREQADRVLAHVAVTRQPMLVLGKRVARAFSWFEGGPPLVAGRVAYLKWYTLLGCEEGQYARAVVVPHPSGINRWWNEEANRAEARAFFTRLKVGTE